MALERFIPKSPDIFIRNSQDFEVAKFGHLNTIVEYINNNSAKPAGLNGYVQFNDNNALGGDAGLFWDNVNKSLGLGSSTPSYLSFKYNPSSGSTYVGGINIYQDGVNLFPIMDFTRFGDTVFRRQQRAIFIYYTNENNGINYTNGQLVSQIETTGVRNGIVGSTLFRESVVYNGDGITRRGRYSYGVAQQSGFGGFQYVATQYGNLKINIIGDNASAYIDDVISPTTAYNMHASNIINTTNNGSLPILSLDYNGLTKHVFQTNGNVSFNNTADMAAILGIKGSGSTSATTSLLVQNSSGTTILKTTDDQVVTVEGFGGRNTTISAGNSSGQGVITADTQSTLSITGGFQGIYLKFNNGTNSSTVARVAHNDFSAPADNQVDLGGLTRWKSVSSVSMSSDQYQLQGTNVLSFNAIPNTGFYVETGATKRITIRTNGSDAIRISETQNIGIGTTSPNVSAKVDITSTTQGFLPPRMTTAQRTAIASPAASLIVFDTDVQNLCYYRDGVWVQATFAAV